MKKVAKFGVITLFSLAALWIAGCNFNKSVNGSAALSQTAATATPAPAAPAAPAAGDKTMTKKFVLSHDSLSEYGDAAFDHENHAFKNYSPDGKSPVACIECHHTDQPKSGLKPPLKTSERDVALTFESWKASTQKVSKCRDCHFQDGNVPDGKEMPTASYTDGGKTTVKDLNNELAYHINCNTCHDEAYKLRPELKQKPGFSTGKDCLICHVKN